MAGIAETNGARRGGPWRLVGWGAAGLLLLVPLVAMQFNDDVNWSAFDFAFMAALLGGLGLGLELAVRKGNAPYTMAAGVALAAAFFLIVINGAVGIIGSEREAANLLFGGVLAVALLGAIAARFRPAGMARAMAAAALAQISVPAIALTFGWAPTAAVWAPEVPASTIFFAALWLGSAWLFRKAAREPAAL